MPVEGREDLRNCGREARDGGSLDATRAWKQARLGDSGARAALIETYWSYVARQVARMGIPATTVQERDDLVSAGTVGLINAVDRFDDNRGVPFEAFARQRIRGAVIDEVRALDTRGRMFWRRLRKGEVTAETAGAPLSLDRLAENGSEPVVADASAPLLEQDLWNDVGSALQDLPQRERDVIRRYYGAARTLREIGSELGVSEARVCQLHARAIAHLRRSLTTPKPAFSAGVA